MNDDTFNDDDPHAVLPVILVCDVSGSMEGSPAATMHTELNNLVQELSRHPEAAAITRLSVVTFADSAHVHVPMSDVPEIDPIAPLQIGGATSYQAVFDLIARALPIELRGLAARGHAVYRPTVFFFSDGVPTDDPHGWRAARDRLTTSAAAPNIVSLGVGDADGAVIRAVAHGRGRAFLARDGSHVCSAVAGAFEAILHATLDSFEVVPALSKSMLRPPIPTEIDGFIPLDLVYAPAGRQ